MSARTKYITQKKEKGLVLLVLVIIIVLTVVTYSFSGISITQVRIDQSKNTMLALKEAKQALINYAVTYSDRTSGSFYGFFPYPEVSLFDSEDGNTDTTITGSLKNTNVIGWLPWRELDIENLKDESETCLFYAVSGTYKFGTSVKADMVNEDSIGMFQVVDDSDPVIIMRGKNVEDRIVALVIAPGEALAGQLRNPTEIRSSCGRDYDNVSAYLEGDGTTDNSFVSLNKDQIDTFIHATETSSSEDPAYNDKFLTITRDEIWKAIVASSDFKQDMNTLTKALAMCMANYANMATNTPRRLPWPVNTGFAVLPTDYRDNANYKDQSLATVTLNGYSGRYPFDVTNSNAAMDPAIVGSNLFDVANCSDFGKDADDVTINLTNAPSITKYRQLWNNWKDHFFYILSKEYEPDTTVVDECGVVEPCIQVNGNQYPGAVIFSGSRLAGVTRNDKSVIADYLENGNDVVFASEQTTPSGDLSYDYKNPEDVPESANDIMYCLEDATPGTDLGVVSCL